MDDRYRFTLTIRCPRCGNGGEAEVSEGDRPVMQSPEFAVDRPPEGIEVTTSAPYRHETEMTCRCGHKFKL